MCLIIYNSNGSKVPEHHIRTAHENNPHGFGIMWAQNGEVKTHRALLDADEIVDIMNDMEGIPYVVHFRYRTRGPISKDMAHPFKVLSKKNDGHDLFMMHNGTFMFLKADEEESDSAKFAKHLRGALRVYGSDSLFDKAQLSRMANRVGAVNKLVFLRGDGKIALVNKNAGWQDGALWYSNTYSLKPAYRTTSSKSSSVVKSKSPLFDKVNEKLSSAPPAKVKLRDVTLLDSAYAYNKKNSFRVIEAVSADSPADLDDADYNRLLVPRNSHKAKTNKNKKHNNKQKLELKKTKLNEKRSIVSLVPVNATKH